MSASTTESAPSHRALAQLNAIIDSSNDAIVGVAPDGTIRSWNKAAERIFGYTAGEAPGRSLFILLPPEGEGAANAMLERLRQGERIEDFETGCLRKDRTRLDVCWNLSPIRDEAGVVTEFSAIGRTLPDRSQARLMAEARDLQQTIFDDLPVLIWRAGLDAKCDYFNRTWLEFTGRKMEEETGDGWTEGVHPDDLNRTVQDYLAAFRARQPFQLEYRLRRHDGEYRTILDFGKPYVSLDGQFAGYIGSCYDVTDRRRAEEKLQRSEDTMSTAQRIARFGSWELDLANPDLRANPLRWSDETFRLFGLEPRSVEVSNELFFRLIPPEDRVLIEEAVGRALRERTEYSLDHRIVLESGEVRYVHEHGRVFADEHTGAPIKMVGTVHDITERKRAELQLQRFISMSPAVIYALKVEDTGLELKWASENLRQLTGYSADEPTGSAWWKERIHPEDRERVAAAHRKPLDEHLKIEFRFRRKDGTYFWVHDEKRLLRDAQGRPVEVVGAWTDATERVQLEQQLRQSQKMEAIGTLAGGVAHDFNNLLTVIQGHSSLLLAKEPSPKELNESLTEIAEAGDRAASLTRQLLIFSRKQFMAPVDLDLNEVVAELTRMLRRIVGEDVVLESEFAPHLPVIHGDRGMIEQILLNLAVNARDAMPRGGRLTIATTAEVIDARGAMENPDATPGPCVRLSVQDTGCGIAPESLPHIFEPFFTTKEVGKGTGLGLATTYGIVNLHRGWITVASEVDRGTVFQIHFPVATGKRAQEKPAPESSDLPPGMETILVVEDEMPVRMMVVSLLTQLNYRVIEAPSGAAALEVWREHRDHIDLLLTDMVMPDGVTGRELASRLLAEKPALKVIYTSGYSPEVAGGGLPLAEGANFLQKPYTAQRLVKVIRESLDRG